MKRTTRVEQGKAQGGGRLTLTLSLGGYRATGQGRGDHPVFRFGMFRSVLTIVMKGGFSVWIFESESETFRSTLVSPRHGTQQAIDGFPSCRLLFLIRTCVSVTNLAMSRDDSDWEYCL